MNNQNVKIGKEFEDLVYAELLKSSPKNIKRNEKIEEIGISIDFLVEHQDGTEEFVEAKAGDNKTASGRTWAGATRTDNVKKAICNGALLKTHKATARYTIFFNHPPRPESFSHRMIEHAKRVSFVDDIRYLDSSTIE